MLYNPKQSENSHKKVLLVGNFLSQKIKVRHVCEDLAEGLTAAGWLVQTASAQSGRLPRLLDMIATIYCRRQQYRVALVEVYSGPAFLWAEAACLALQALGKPYVLALHGGNLPAFARRWSGRVRRLLQSAVRVTTPSNYLLQEMPRVRSNVRVIPNGLDLSKYPYRWRSQPQPRLIWLRALASIYNPWLALRSLALLIPEFPDLHLRMIGPDKGDGILSHMQQRAKDLGLLKHLTFHGPVPKAEVPYWLSKGDIFLNTTNIDNLPVSVLEAMASGLCVVSTNVGGIPYLIEDGHDALLVPPDDEKAMAAAVRRILTEPGLAARLSHNARRKAEQFDWSVILPQWEALLTAVAEGPRS